MSKKIELLRKIRELAERGVGGESVGMNYRPTKSETDGYMKIVSEPISQKYVELAAVSCNAEVVL